jgi:hypothetical protein
MSVVNERKWVDGNGRVRTERTFVEEKEVEMQDTTASDQQNELVISQVLERISKAFAPFTVADRVEEMDNILRAFLAEEREGVGALLSTDFSGFVEGFNPKASLATISDDTINLLAEISWQASNGRIDVAPSARFFCIEAMKRKGQIIDWDFTRETQFTGNFSYQLKEPLKFVSGVYTVNPSSTKEG